MGYLAQDAVDMADAIDEVLTDAAGSGEYDRINGARMRNFASAGLLTRDEGLVIKLPNGAEFEVTVVMRKAPDKPRETAPEVHPAEETDYARDLRWLNDASRYDELAVSTWFIHDATAEDGSTEKHLRLVWRDGGTPSVTVYDASGKRVRMQTDAECAGHNELAKLAVEEAPRG